jgi:hypothetical protein
MKSYYWCPRQADIYEEVSEDEAARLEEQGEFVTTSLASAVFYLCN